jgi:hypothetical protein
MGAGKVKIKIITLCLSLAFLSLVAIQTINPCDVADGWIRLPGNNIPFCVSQSASLSTLAGWAFVFMFVCIFRGKEIFAHLLFAAVIIAVHGVTQYQLHSGFAGFRYVNNAG